LHRIIALVTQYLGLGIVLLDFHDKLRQAGIRVSLTEWLVLMHGMSKGLGTLHIDQFYAFAKLALVKNEALYDRFDQVFSLYWSGQAEAFEQMIDSLSTPIAQSWLQGIDSESLSDEQKAQVEAMGGWDKLMETLAKRLQEQQEWWLQSRGHSHRRWYAPSGQSCQSVGKASVP